VEAAAATMPDLGRKQAQKCRQQRPASGARSVPKKAMSGMYEGVLAFPDSDSESEMHMRVQLQMKMRMQMQMQTLTGGCPLRRRVSSSSSNSCQSLTQIRSAASWQTQAQSRC
jgi:hypothetical protein